MGNSRHSIHLDHIDPRNGKLVSGLDVPENLIALGHIPNSVKGNRFVPYRVEAFAAPRALGDMCEFLINGEWLVCEFGGKTWRKESNRIGNHSVDGGKAQGRINVENGHWASIQAMGGEARKKGVIITRLEDGEEFIFDSRGAACKALNLHHVLLREVVRGERKQTKGFTARKL